MQTTQTPSRVLVLANSVTDTATVVEQVRALGANRILVVAPALSTRLRHWTNDDRLARDAARDRLLMLLGRLERAGLEVEGMIGDPDPAQAVEDALHVFPADGIVVVNQRAGSPNRLVRGLVQRIREGHRIPLVELAAGGPRREPVPEAA